MASVDSAQKMVLLDYQETEMATLKEIAPMVKFAMHLDAQTNAQST